VRIVTTIAVLRELLDDHRCAGRSVGLVPTMGYLHAGHQSLMRRSATENDVTVTTVFVNPLQFAPGEDLDAYPRDPDGDVAKAEAAGTDLLFMPDHDEMYPTPIQTTVRVGGIAGPLEGRSRPTFFDGVATVVAKLFSIAGPCRAYFGEKDFQQLLVVRRLAADLSLPVDVVGCPIVRESDGLAMSSRNAYLTGAHRDAAPVLHRALTEGAQLLASGETDVDVVRRAIEASVADEPRVALDYVAVVDAETLLAPAPDVTGLRLLIAAQVGPARLIDNIGATRSATG
jgi:pantoate--beta-alanine ligase